MSKSTFLHSNLGSIIIAEQLPFRDDINQPVLIPSGTTNGGDESSGSVEIVDVAEPEQVPFLPVPGSSADPRSENFDQEEQKKAFDRVQEAFGIKPEKRESANTKSGSDDSDGAGSREAVDKINEEVDRLAAELGIEEFVANNKTPLAVGTGVLLLIALLK